jgi:hypothetical protein
MIRHTVLWTLKEHAEGESKTVNAARMVKALRGLTEQIPGIIELEVGTNAVPSADSYDVALCILFRDERDLDVYQKHPAHLKAVEFIRKVRDKRAVVDFKIEEPLIG